MSEERISKEITDESFLKEIGVSGLSVVKFWQDNCEPCKKMESIYEDAAFEFPDIRFYSAKRPYNSNILNVLRIFSTPTFVVFRDGIELNRGNGEISLEDFKSFIDLSSKITSKDKAKALEIDKARSRKGFLVTQLQKIQVELAQVDKFIMENE